MKKILINLKRNSCPILRSERSWLARLVKVHFYLSWTYGDVFAPPAMMHIHRELWDGSASCELSILWVTLQIKL